MEFNNWPGCSSDRKRRWTVIQICWHSLLHNVAAIKNGNMVCHPKRLARIMCDEERSCPGGFNRSRDMSAHLAAQRSIKGRKRLVEHHQPRCRGKRSS
jgi:hypothetical protein